MKNLFIIISSNQPTGPVKGAYALANLLANDFNVTLITLKPGINANAFLSNKVKFYCLNNLASSFLGGLFAYKRILKQAGTKDSVISFSMTFSADLINIFCRMNALTFVSIRGNLFKNYYYDYGFLGLFLALFHFFSLRWFDKVIAMNKNMAFQVNFYSGKKSIIIGNFVDELSLESYRSNTSVKEIRFIFIGNLSERKQPLLIIDAFKEIRSLGVSATLDFVGVGPLLVKLQNKIKHFNLENYINIHGFVANPGYLLASSDVFVLPSMSEGISRASLEALYLGIPCVLRRIDGNSELIKQGQNGMLFTENSELANAMLCAAKISKSNILRENLLPSRYRQINVKSKYIKYLGQSYGQ